MSRKSSYATILQFGGCAISALRARDGGGGLLIDRVYTERFDSHPEWPRAIGEFVKDNGLADDDFYTVIPRHEITARIIELPSHNQEELAGMVALNAEDFVPFTADELITAFTVLDKAHTGTAKVFAAVAHRDLIHGHIEILREAGIAPRQVFLSTTCLIDAVAASPPPESHCFAVVNLAQGGLEVVVFNEGVVEYARGIATDTNWSVEDAEARGEAVAELSHEIQNSLSAHRRESFMGASATEVYLCSDTGGLAAIAEALDADKDYECKPATFGLNVGHAEAVDFGSAVPLVAAGAAVEALGETPWTIHLLPEDELGQRAAATRRKSAVRVTAFAAAAIVALTALYTQAVMQRTGYLSELEQQADVLRPRIAGLIAKRKHLERLKQQVERKDTALELLAGLVGLLPDEGVNITRYEFYHDDRIELNGRATAQEAVLQLTKDLNNAGLESYKQFARAQRMYITDTRYRNQGVYMFRFDIPFAPEEEEGANE